MKFLLEERFILTEAEYLNSSELEAAAGESVAKTDTETTLPAKDLGEINWERDYKNCKNSQDYEAFWKKYFATVWEKNAEKVKNLKGQFMSTLVELGWDNEENPFVALVEDILNNKIGTKLELENIQSLDTIVKAFANKVISELDLRGKGKLQRYNLIFNPKFYLLSANDQTKYLALQAAFIKAAEGTNIQRTFINIFSSAGDSKNFSAVIPLDSDAPLRTDTARIKVLIERATGKSIEEKSEATDETVLKLVKGINSATDAKKAISYLYDIFSYLDAVAVKEVNAASAKDLEAIKNSTSVNAAESESFRKFFKLKNTNYKHNIIKSLLTKLLEKASGNTSSEV